MTGISRRRFLQASVAAGLVAPAPVAYTLGSPVVAGAASGVPESMVVLVNLRGGLDGLSAVVPIADGGYRDNRTLTAVPAGETHRLDDHFGLHPALGPLLPLYRSGMLAPVVAVGSTRPSRSHFEQQSALDLGVSGSAAHPTGWLARHLASVGGDGVLRGTSNGFRLASVLRGADRSAAIDSLDRFDLQAVPAEHADRMRRAFAAASGGGRYGAAAADLGAVLTAVDRTPEPNAVGGYADDAVGRQFRDVAALLRAGLGVRAAVIELGGWDTHAGQGGAEGRLARNLGRLANGISALLADLDDLGERLTVVVVSEFGRRVRENGSGGTDHGRGGVALVAGQGIVGGRVFGDWPGLAANQLDGGDVRVTTDVRDVLAEVVDRRLGNPDVGTVFPGLEPRPLGFA